MLRRLLLICCLLTLGSTAAHASAPGPFGLGIVLIDPTGISTNYYYDKQKSFAGALGWGDNHLRLNIDHLWYRRDIIVIDRTPIDLYFGIGGRYFQQERRNRDDENEIGVRLPVGVAYLFRKFPAQLFGELGPAIVLVDESAFIIDISIGARYYF